VCYVDSIFTLFYLLFRHRDLVLAAMKSAVPSAGAGGNSPTFGSQELRDTRYVNVMCIWFTCYVPPTFDCSVKMDKQDNTRPAYACWFQVLVISLFIFFSRRIKTKTEKAMYAEKVGVNSSGDLR
jgi:hypothetical protein